MERGETPASSIRERMGQLAQDAERRKRLSLLRTDSIRKAEFFKTKATIDVHDIYSLVKSFFQEFLEERQEFTLNELRERLKTIYLSSTTRKMVDDLLHDLHAVEYANVHYNRAQLTNILDRFSEMVRQLIKTHTTSKTIFTKIRNMFFKQTDPQTIIAELPVIEHDTQREIRVKILVEKCYVALDKHNIHRAKASYKILLDEYEQLDTEMKKEFYHTIHQTYQDIHNRELMIK